MPPAFGTTAARRPGLGFGHVLLHRAAGHELDHHKGQQQHAQQGGKHQQKAFEDVGKHGRYGGAHAHQGSAAPLENRASKANRAKLGMLAAPRGRPVL